MIVSVHSESIRGCPTCEVKCHYVYTQSPLEKVYEFTSTLVYVVYRASPCVLSDCEIV